MSEAERPRRVAVLSRSFSNHPTLRSELLGHFPDTRFNDSGRTLAGSELIAFVAGYDGVVAALERLDADALNRMTDLRVLSKYGVGLDNVDLRRHRVSVSAWAGPRGSTAAPLPNLRSDR